MRYENGIYNDSTLGTGGKKPFLMSKSASKDVSHIVCGSEEGHHGEGQKPLVMRSQR